VNLRGFLECIAAGPVKKVWALCRAHCGTVEGPPVLPRGVAVGVAGRRVLQTVPFGLGPTAGLLLLRFDAGEARQLAWTFWEAARLADQAERSADHEGAKRTARRE
jgi:hypothetical protein